jgi:site-specific DNA-adenine methylase
MIFMGGKGRWAKKIVAEIEPWRTPGDTLIEVCCGAANLTEHWTKPVIAYDLNPALITMWKAAQAGWRPPLREDITPELHAMYKKNPDPSDPLTAFLLFGCSFRGVWRGGFARNTEWEGRTLDFVSRSRRGMIRKADAVSVGVEFLVGSYSDASPRRDHVVYVDPPYVGRCAQGIADKTRSIVGPFDHVAFWKHVGEWSSQGTRVFVSEETAPSEWIRYRSWKPRRTLGNWSEVDRNGPRKLESIWVHRDSEMAAKANGDMVICEP